MDFITYLAGEAKMIGQAPVTYLVTALIIGLIVYLWVRHQYADRIASVEGRLQLRDDKIADYESKLQGASPDEAAQLVAALEKRLAALEPRSLNPVQIKAIEDTVKVTRNKLTIVLDAASPECKVLAGQIKQAFASAGWPVAQGTALGIGYPPKSGIGLTTGTGNSMHSGADEVKQALSLAGLSYDLLPNHPAGHPDGTIQILLTTPSP